MPESNLHLAGPKTLFLVEQQVSSSTETIWAEIYVLLHNHFWSAAAVFTSALADSSTSRRRAAVQQAGSLPGLPAQFGSGPDVKQIRRSRQNMTEPKMNGYLSYATNCFTDHSWEYWNIWVPDAHFAHTFAHSSSNIHLSNLQSLLLQQLVLYCSSSHTMKVEKHSDVMASSSSSLVGRWHTAAGTFHLSAGSILSSQTELKIKSGN